MSDKSRSREYLLSSTPFHSPEEDSGYFGSSHRSLHRSNALNTYSPIAESGSRIFSIENSTEGSSPENKLSFKILDYESFSEDFSKTSRVEINDLSELEFISDTDSREGKIFKSSTSLSFGDSFNNKSDSTKSFDKNEDIKYQLFEDMPSDFMRENSSFLRTGRTSLKNYNLIHGSRQTKVDFISQLKEMNCFSLISTIFSYLSDKELCIASCVNKVWNQVILNDTKSNCRRRHFINERDLFLNGPSKENRLGKRCVPAREMKKAFSDMTNNYVKEQSVTSTDSNTKFESFIKESKNGHSKLLKCPKCSFAARKWNSNIFLCTHCSFTFCCNCLNPAFRNHTTCTEPQLPNITVGSRRSKKNLRRL